MPFALPLRPAGGEQFLFDQRGALYAELARGECGELVAVLLRFQGADLLRSIGERLGHHASKDFDFLPCGRGVANRELVEDVQHFDERVAPGAPAGRRHLVAAIGSAHYDPRLRAVIFQVLFAYETAATIHVARNRIRDWPPVESSGARYSHLTEYLRQPGLAEDFALLVGRTIRLEEVLGRSGIASQRLTRTGPSGCQTRRNSEALLGQRDRGSQHVRPFQLAVFVDHFSQCGQVAGHWHDGIAKTLFIGSG